VSEYLFAGRLSELERLRLQAEVWEPAGRRLLERLGRGNERRALDVGCSVLGWLRILVDAGWRTTGSDIDPVHLDQAAQLRLPLELVVDDLFDSALEPGSFDLVHARFQLCPLGRWDEQIEAYKRLLRPGGILVLEDPDSSSWSFNPRAPAAMRLIELIRERFAAAGSDYDVGRALPSLLRAHGIEPSVDAHVVALPPGHPYLRLPLQFAASLGIEEHLADAEAELAEPDRWGVTQVLVQAWGET
jgi:SAM-dependent methyltransferase